MMEVHTITATHETDEQKLNCKQMLLMSEGSMIGRVSKMFFSCFYFRETWNQWKYYCPLCKQFTSSARTKTGSKLIFINFWQWQKFPTMVQTQPKKVVDKNKSNFIDMRCFLAKNNICLIYRCKCYIWTVNSWV